MRGVMNGGGIALGALLGVANTLVILVGVGVSVDASAYEIVCGALIGTLPGLLVGLALGALAMKLHSVPVLARLVALLTPACFVVLWLGGTLHMQEYVGFAFVPTAIATLILERFTRGLAVGEAVEVEPTVVEFPRARVVAIATRAYPESAASKSTGPVRGHRDRPAAP
jgi:hypothetical protein